MKHRQPKKQTTIKTKEEAQALYTNCMFFCFSAALSNAIYTTDMSGKRHRLRLSELQNSLKLPWHIQSIVDGCVEVDKSEWCDFDLMKRNRKVYDNYIKVKESLSLFDFDSAYAYMKDID